MAKSRRGTKKDVVVWVRVPQGTDLKKLKKLGADAIAVLPADAGLAAIRPGEPPTTIVSPRSPELRKLLEEAGLNPEAACYGGDTCIA